MKGCNFNKVAPYPAFCLIRIRSFLHGRKRIAGPVFLKGGTRFFSKGRIQIRIQEILTRICNSDPKVNIEQDIWMGYRSYGTFQYSPPCDVRNLCCYRGIKSLEDVKLPVLHGSLLKMRLLEPYLDTLFLYSPWVLLLILSSYLNTLTFFFNNFFISSSHH